MIPIATSPSERGSANTQRPCSPGTGTLTAARGCPSRSARTSRCEPRLGRSSTAVVRASVHTPAATTVRRARTVNAAPVQASTASTPSSRRAVTSAYVSTLRAVGGGGAGDRDDQPRVVLQLAVPGQQRAAQPARRQRGREPARLERAHAPRRRQHPAAGARRGPQPVAQPQADHRLRGGAAGDRAVERDQERQRPDEVRRDRAHQRRALDRGLPGQRRRRRAGGTAGRRARASSSSGWCRGRGRGARAARPTGRARRRRAPRRRR